MNDEGQLNNHVQLYRSSQYSDQVAHVEAGDRHFHGESSMVGSYLYVYIKPR